MCRLIAKPERNVCIWEGWARWIAERDTTEEKLAAYETIMAIAFPEDESSPYTPPPKPTDGSKLSRCDLIRRDVYNQWHGVIEKKTGVVNQKTKSQVRAEAGRLGAAKRWGQRYRDDSTSGDSTVLISEEVSSDYASDISSIEPPKIAPQASTPTTPLKPTTKEDIVVVGGNTALRVPKPSPLPQDGLLETLEPYRKPNRYEAQLSEGEKAQVATWRKKFPDAKALQNWIAKSWRLPNRKIATSDNFCNYAFAVLDEERNWCGALNHRPITNLGTTLHWLVITYMRQCAEIEVATKKIEREKREADFDERVSLANQNSPEEVADRLRKERLDAERDAMERIMRGEVLGDA